MENLMQRYGTASQAIQNFKEGLDEFNQLLKQQSYDLKEYRRYRDSLVKRFELAVDTLWKYLKFYLQEKEGISQNSPKAVLRECLRTRLITEYETARALVMIDARNEATHIYREVVAEELLKKLPEFYGLMNKLITNAPVPR
jgi:nucleotidyltransferase substrate binding protein (TIGR01987 family)